LGFCFSFPLNLSLRSTNYGRMSAKKSIALIVLVAVVIGIINFEFPEGDPNYDNLDSMHNEIQRWHSRGKFTEFFGHKVFYIKVPYSGGGGDKEKNNIPTILLVHGFPTSSFDYAEVIDPLSKHANVIVHDHVGFGFSDKPRKNFTYSIFEHADIAIKIWEKLAFTNGIIVAHDMGDSVAAEILSRHSRDLLPSQIRTHIKGVVFTNGGMKISLSKFRISQIILKSSFGNFLNWFIHFIGIPKTFAVQQLGSIWSPTYENSNKKQSDIDGILEIASYKGGNFITHKTIRYLQDRYDFEYKWLDGIKKVDFPCTIVWGDSDAVAPIEIAREIKRIAPNCVLKELKGVGHFLMLEAPKLWISEIVENVLNNHHLTKLHRKLD